MMQTYVGTKTVRAIPMTRLAYNQFRGWVMPADETDDDGFLVEYIDGGKANTDQYDGYVSWSPKEVFERAYRPVDTESFAFSFGEALDLMERGVKVSRVGWNGKGMFLFLVPGSTFSVNRPPLLGIYPEGTVINYRPHIDMKTADGQIVPWVASQSDILARDWLIVA